VSLRRTGDPGVRATVGGTVVKNAGLAPCFKVNFWPCHAIIQVVIPIYQSGFLGELRPNEQLVIPFGKSGPDWPLYFT